MNLFEITVIYLFIGTILAEGIYRHTLHNADTRKLGGFAYIIVTFQWPLFIFFAMLIIIRSKKNANKKK